MGSILFGSLVQGVFKGGPCSPTKVHKKVTISLKWGLFTSREAFFMEGEKKGVEVHCYRSRNFDGAFSGKAYSQTYREAELPYYPEWLQNAESTLQGDRLRYPFQEQQSYQRDSTIRKN